MTLPDEQAADFREKLELFERRIPWMYLDSGGLVTTALGHMVRTAADAEAIGHTAFGWQQVHAADKGHYAEFYQVLTQTRLDDMAIDRIREADIRDILHQLSYAIPGVDGYPAPVRQAVLDMAFMGVRRLVDQFFAQGRKFGPLLAAGDWQGAAMESERKGVQPERNRYVADLIRSATAKAANG